MSTNQQENRRSDVIRCEFCGEDYSVTYRRCPFCDDRAGVPMDSRRSAGSKKGGRRVAPTNKRGGGYGGSLRPVQVIGIALSIILIIAAIYIVYSVLAPLFSGGQGDGSTAQPSVSTSQPSVSTPDVSVPDVSAPDVSVPDVSTPVVPDPDPTVVAPVVSATAITLSKKDVTAAASETFTLKATVTPANSDDKVVWTSSNEAAAKVDQNGVVTNVNTGSSTVQVTITAQAGDVSATCLVRCKGGSTGSAGTSSTTPSTGTSTGTATALSGTGVITGTSTGLLIRSGPGRQYEAQDTAMNGAEVKLLEDTGTGWYKISYTGANGRTATGYASKDYVKVK